MLSSPSSMASGCIHMLWLDRLEGSIGVHGRIIVSVIRGSMYIRIRLGGQSFVADRNQSRLKNVLVQ